MPRSVIVIRYVHGSFLRPEWRNVAYTDVYCVHRPSLLSNATISVFTVILAQAVNSVTLTSQLLLDQARTRLDACHFTKLRVAFVSRYHNTHIYTGRQLSGGVDTGMVRVSKIAITAPRRFRQGSSITATNQERHQLPFAVSALTQDELLSLWLE